MSSRKVFLFLTALAALWSSSAGGQMLRSGNSVSCDVQKDCTQEEIGGRRFYVIVTPQMTVKVAVDPDPRYSHVVVSLENRSPYDIHVTPSDFRIEVEDPKVKRLSYIEPEKLKLPKAKAAKAPATPKPTVSNGFMASSSAPAAPEAGTIFLTDTKLAPEGTANGEVFFEHTKVKAPMSLVLPIGGVIYDFPFSAAK